MQSEVIDSVLYSDKSVVVSAPTGSGKTVVLELAIIRLLNQIEVAGRKDDFMIIYMAPIKALCNEITADWKIKFDRLGVLCGSVTGDDNDFDFASSKYKIIVTTPEKWDSLSRKWNGCNEYMKTIKLFMIDEVHLLNEDKRGPILEAVVSRMKTIRIKLNENYGVSEKIRFVAVSATIPNISDLALWLDDKDSIVYHKVSEELRPVKLEKHVIGYSFPSNTAFRFDMNLTYRLPSIIEQYSNNKPVLIFCNSRKSTEMAAATIIDKLRLNLSDEQRQNLTKLSKQIMNNKLRPTISNGVAFHHAGLCVTDRKLVEDTFREGLIPILFSTNTLAVGVNLPAYLVIIKSTEMIVPGGVHELSEAVVLQMIGRAGRPQFDVHGIAVIMTQNSKVKKYESLVAGTAPIESHLHKHLIEHINSEIVSLTISNVDLAVQWIRSSYLYIRAIQQPFHYDLPKNAARSFVEKKLEELCINAIDELEAYGLVRKENSLIRATPLGRLMAHYYLSFTTMKHFKKITGTENNKEMFDVLIRSPDFVNNFHLRVSDKRYLNDLNGESVRFPIQGKVKNVADKISCLVQALFGNIPISDASLTEEATQMIKLGQRMGHALQEYVTLLDAQNNFFSLVSTILLIKSFHVNLWENSTYVSKQIKKIGHVYSKLLSSKGKTTFESILKSKPSDIEMILKKRPPFGNEFLDAVSILPQYTLEMELKDDHIFVVARQINPTFVCDPFSHGVTLVIGNSMNETLLINHNVEYFLVKFGKFERTIALKNNSASTVTCHLIHNGIVGLDKSTEIILHEPVVEMMEIEVEPEKVSKRKTVQKGQKQLTIRECITSGSAKKPKKRNKSEATHQIPPKKKKINVFDEIHSVRSMESNNNNVLKVENVLDVREEPTTQTVYNEHVIIRPVVNLSHEFKAPVKSSFKHSLSLKDILSCSLYEDITESEDPIIQTQQTKTNIELNNTVNVYSTMAYVQPKEVKFKYIRPRNIENQIQCKLQTNNIVQSKLERKKCPKEHEILQHDSALTTQHLDDRWDDKLPYLSNERTTVGDKDQNILTKSNLIENENGTQRQFVPTCIKSMFGNKTVNRTLSDSYPEAKNRQMKDIRLRYDHLLTSIRMEERITLELKCKSLYDIIEDLQQISQTPMNSRLPVYPFQTQTNIHFCAAKEMEKIEQINRSQDDTNNGLQLSFEINDSFQFNNSSDFFSDEKSRLNERLQRIEKKTPLNGTASETEMEKWICTDTQLPFKRTFPANDIWKHSYGLPNSQTMYSTQQLHESHFSKGPIKSPSRINIINVNPTQNLDPIMNFSRTSKMRFPAYEPSQRDDSNACDQSASLQSLFTSQIGSNTVRHNNQSPFSMNYNKPYQVTNNLFSMGTSQVSKYFQYSGNM